MALNLLFPRIEWNDISKQGDTTNGSPTISNIADTSDLKVGMVVTGSGVPTDSVIISKTSSSITLDQNCTITAASVSIALLERLDFRFPPVKDSEDQPKAFVTSIVSLSGIRQTQANYIEHTRTLSFNFLTYSERDKLINDFFVQWAAYGKEFRFYYDQDDAPYTIYEISDFQPKYGRTVKKHPYFLYSFDMKFRRVEGLTSTAVTSTEDCAMYITGSYIVPVLITAAGGITPAVGKDRQGIFIAGDSAAINITANPQIVAGTTVGQSLLLYGCDDTDTVQIDDGNGVELLGGASWLASDGSYLHLIWRGSAWAELGRG